MSCPTCWEQYPPADSNFSTRHGENEFPVPVAQVPSDHFVVAYATEERFYKVTCSKGHTFWHIFELEKFEMLFASAINAFCDSYYREAVSTIAVGLERAYEFAIQVMAHAQGINQVQLDQAWKGVAKQSERQLGAFQFLWLTVLKEIAPATPKVDFRNDVVHKGYFPSLQQTIDYMNLSFELTNYILKTLFEKCNGSFMHIYERNIDEIQTKHKKDSLGFVGITSPMQFSFISQYIEGGKPLTADMLFTMVYQERAMLMRGSGQYAPRSPKQ